MQQGEGSVILMSRSMAPARLCADFMCSRVRDRHMRAKTQEPGPWLQLACLRAHALQSELLELPREVRLLPLQCIELVLCDQSLSVRGMRV